MAMRIAHSWGVAAGCLVSGLAHADWPALPTEYYGPNTVLVAQAQLEAVSASHLEATIRTLIDVEALTEFGVEVPPDAEDEIVAQTAGVSMFTQPLLEAGMTTVAVVVMVHPGAGDGAAPTPAVYVLLSGESEEAAEAFAAAVRAGEQPMMAQIGSAAAVAQFVDDDRTDSWVVLPFQDVALPEEWSPQRQRRFEGAASDLGDYPVRAVFASNLALRDAAQPAVAEQSLPVRGAVGAIMDAEWVGVVADLGERPSLGVVAQMGDQADADLGQVAWGEVLQLINKGCQALDEEVQASRQEGAPAPKVSFFQLGVALETLLEMDRAENRLRVALDTQELTDTTTILLRIVSEYAGLLMQRLMPLFE